jgi:hypothetical protein
LARLYFHLTNGNEVIRDETGIEIDDWQSAGREADAVIAEMRRLGDFTAQEWTGWRFEITTESGVVLTSIGLSFH